MKYTPELRRRVLGPVKVGKSVARGALDMAVSDQRIYSCREQDLIDSGTISTDNTELVTAKRRINKPGSC